MLRDNDIVRFTKEDILLLRDRHPLDARMYRRHKLRKRNPVSTTPFPAPFLLADTILSTAPQLQAQTRKMEQMYDTGNTNMAATIKRMKLPLSKAFRVIRVANLVIYICQNSEALDALARRLAIWSQ
jgi:hypothetical protein